MFVLLFFHPEIQGNMHSVLSQWPNEPVVLEWGTSLASQIVFPS